MKWLALLGLFGGLYVFIGCFILRLTMGVFRDEPNLSWVEMLQIVLRWPYLFFG